MTVYLRKFIETFREFEKSCIRLHIALQLLREYFNQALPSSDVVRYPVAFIHLTVPPAEVDVNLEPNKTRVLLHNQVLLLV